MLLQRGFDRRLNLLPQLPPNGLQAFIDLLPQLLPDRVQGLVDLLEEILPHWLKGQNHLLAQLLPDRLQRLIDLLLQLLPYRLKHLVHLLEHGIRDLALHLLQDGMDSLGDLFLEHLPQIHLGAHPLTVLRRTWPVALVPSRRLVLPSLLMLRIRCSMLRSGPGIVVMLLSVRRVLSLVRCVLSLVVGLSVAAARRVMVYVVRVSTARTRLGGLRALPRRLI